MADTSIEWTDKTWNPTRGCKRVSPGCKNCYAERMALRFSGPGQPYEGLVVMTSQGPKWTGKVIEVPSMLDAPLHWKKPQRIFVDSMSDLFEEQVSDAFIDKVFAVMALCPQHTFQILTKRPERMQQYLNAWPSGAGRVHHVFSAVHARLNEEAGKTGWNSSDPEFARAQEAVKVWPLPNVWLGASAEDQERLDERLPELIQAPAAVRFISAEPLLGPLKIDRRFLVPIQGTSQHGQRFIDWVITGFESGPKARPGHPRWLLWLRNQCDAAGVAFLHKQNGEFAEADMRNCGAKQHRFIELDGTDSTDWTIDRHSTTTVHLVRVGKKASGRLLDGRTHDGFPK